MDKMPKPSLEDLEKWNKILAKEGMPEEISMSEHAEVEHTHAYEDAVMEAQQY